MHSQYPINHPTTQPYRQVLKKRYCTQNTQRGCVFRCPTLEKAPVVQGSRSKVATLLCCIRYCCLGAAADVLSKDVSNRSSRGSCRIRNVHYHILCIRLVPYLTFRCDAVFLQFLLHEGYIKTVVETFYQVSIIYFFLNFKCLLM